MLVKPLAACTHLSSTVSQLFEPQVQKNRRFHVPQPTFLFPLETPLRLSRECHAAKRTTRQLESKYRQQRTTETLTAWKRQFDIQRSMYETKFVAFWTATVDVCKHNPRKLWRTVHELLQPPKQQVSEELSADNFADYFRSKVAIL